MFARKNPVTFRRRFPQRHRSAARSRHSPNREYFARLSAFVRSLDRDDTITSAAADASTASGTAGSTAPAAPTAAVAASDATADAATPVTAAVVDSRPAKTSSDRAR